MEKILSLGYDLGDGETIIDAVTFQIQDGNNMPFAQQEIGALRMPDSSKDGEAIPTGFGYDERKNVVFSNSISGDPESISDIHAYFKRKPTDLLGNISKERSVELINLFENGTLPSVEDCPEINSREFEEFKESVQTFTDAIFSDGTFKQSVSFHAQDCDRIKFCVGHPTKWNRLDALIYFAILNETILGNGKYLKKPAELVLAEESRAAYLYMREQNKITAGNMQILPQGTCSLLIDVGSSTIDVTAVTKDARNSQYNSGNNYLGVRSIDFMIKDWFLKELKAKDSLSLISSIIKNNPSQETAMILACRKAKEQAYSTANGTSQISFQVVKKLTQKDIDHLAKTKSVAATLGEFIRISPDSTEELQKLGNASWTALFRKFLEEQKTALQDMGLKIGRIIMTGSAVRMSFVPEIIREVFNEVPKNEKILDASPSHSISKGLALVGSSDAKSKQFQQTIEQLNSTDIPEIIKRDLPSLASNIAPIIENIIVRVVLEQVERWRKGYIKTLNDMSANIERELSADNLKSKLESSEEYNAALKKWTVDALGKDIANKLLQICDQYNVTGFDLDSLNVAKNVAINPQTGRIEIAPYGGVVDFAGAIAGIIGGIITFVIFPAVVGAVLLIISSISATIAGILFTVLAAIPGPGWFVIAAVVAIAIGKLIAEGVDGFKNDFNKKVANYDIPLIIDPPFLPTVRPRERVTDDKIKKKIAEQNLKDKIEEALLKDQTNVAKSVSAAISEQVKQRTDEIKFFIES